MSSTAAGICAAVEREVVDLHRFFAEWFSGTGSMKGFDKKQQNEAFKGFVARFHPDIVYVLPGGKRVGMAYIQGIKGAFGFNPDFTIKVKGIETTVVPGSGGNVVSAVYKEYQSGAKNSARNNGRITTALFVRRGPQLVWFRIHECWLPQQQQGVQLDTGTNAAGQGSHIRPILKRSRNNALKDVFSLMDADASGGISIQELLRAMKYVDEKMTFEEVARAFNKMDSSRDRSVQVDEFLKYFGSRFSSLSDAKFHRKVEATERFLSRKPALEGLFATFDADKSGHLDENELLLMMSKVEGKEVKSRRALKLLRKMDANEDGKIDKKEFVSHMFSSVRRLTDEQFRDKMELLTHGRRYIELASLFHMYDADGNGTLDLNEFARMLRQNGNKHVDVDTIITQLCQFDKNKDRMVSLAEYTGYMLAHVVGAMDDASFNAAIRAMKKHAGGRGSV